MVKLLKFYFFHPQYWVLFIDKIFNALRTRLRTKLVGLYSPKWYPKEIRESVTNIDTSFPPLAQIPECLRELKEAPQWNELINIAGTELSVNALSSIWKDGHKDNEVIFASHRFHWLLEVLSNGINKDIYKKCEEVLLLWHNKTHHHYSWEPYSISERICQFSIFYWLTKNHNYLSEELEVALRSSIHSHSLRLVANLEYPASNITNNHVLNNARALYFAGTFLNNTDLKQLSKKIFTKEKKKIIDESGFLKECSTHYQFLLNKNILELALLERNFESNTYFQELASLMLGASLLLIPSSLKSNSDLPLIGDISPDIPSHWFLPERECGWSKIWDNKIVLKKTNLSSGWTTIELNKWFLLAQTHQEIGPYPYGHGHDDFGGFVLYYDGSPVFIDRGRNSYSSQLVEGISRTSHNTLVESPTPALISGKGITEGPSIHSKSLMNSETTKESLKFSLNNVWNRKITLHESEVKIIDSPIMALEGYLYLSSELNLSKTSENEFHLEQENIKYNLQFDNLHPTSEKIDSFPSYGKSKEAIRIKWKASKPYSIRLSING